MIWAIGEALIDFVALDAGARLGDVSRFERAPGGAPANVAAGVGRLGGQAGFIGKVGADEFGRCIRDTLFGCGVDVSQLRMTEEARTALAFVSLTADGERDFLFYRNPGADMLLRADDIDMDRLGGSILHYGSLSLIHEPARSAVQAAAAEARRRGAFLSYDPNLRLNLWPSADAARETILWAMAWADFVKVSEEELLFLTRETDLTRGIQKLMALGPAIVAVTFGAGGAYLATPTGSVQVPGFQAATIDTTGAGDGWVAGFLLGLTEAGRPPAALDLATLEGIVRFANAVGALVTTRLGAISALPTRQEVLRLLNR